MDERAADAAHYRYERKFVADNLELPEVEAIIAAHPAVFSEIYHARYINNVYLDDALLSHYYATIEGDRQRVKARIRWYGDLEGAVTKPVLELKIKQGLVGTKQSYPLAPFTLAPDFGRDTLEAVFRASDLPERVSRYVLGLEPVLLNRYRRRYFQSADRVYRVTVDSAMEVLPVRVTGSRFVQRVVDRLNKIVELKYAREADEGADAISRHLPFRLTKNSKYTRGVAALYYG